MHNEACLSLGDEKIKKNYYTGGAQYLFLPSYN